MPASDMAPVIQALNDEVKSGREKMTEVLAQLRSVNTSLEAVKDDIDHLTQVVSTGNGQPSILHRVTTLEAKQVTAINDLTELKTKLDTFTNTKMLTRGQIIAGVLGMVTTAVLSLGAIIAQLFK